MTCVYVDIFVPARPMVDSRSVLLDETLLGAMQVVSGKIQNDRYAFFRVIESENQEQIEIIAYSLIAVVHKSCSIY
jgi:hypothetical protein